MTCHYLDLGSASDRLKIWFIHWSEALPRSGYWGIIGLTQASFRGETSRGAAKCLLFSYAISQESQLLLFLPRLSNAWPVTQAGAWRAKIKSGRRRLLIISLTVTRNFSPADFIVKKACLARVYRHPQLCPSFRGETRGGEGEMSTVFSGSYP